MHFDLDTICWCLAVSLLISTDQYAGSNSIHGRLSIRECCFSQRFTTPSGQSRARNQEQVQHGTGRVASRQEKRENFGVINTGSLPNTEKTFLFKTVAKNNAIFIDMIRKIKLKDRSETAWTIIKHESIHYALKAGFEIDDRFDQIDFKLNLIQQNAKFFLEVLQSQKSNSLEWCIVILILLECAIMSIDMSGMGPSLYEYISSWISWPTTTTTDDRRQRRRFHQRHQPREHENYMTACREKS